MQALTGRSLRVRAGFSLHYHPCQRAKGEPSQSRGIGSLAPTHFLRRFFALFFLFVDEQNPSEALRGVGWRTTFETPANRQSSPSVSAGRLPRSQPSPHRQDAGQHPAVSSNRTGRHPATMTAGAKLKAVQDGRSQGGKAGVWRRRMGKGCIGMGQRKGTPTPFAPHMCCSPKEHEARSHTGRAILIQRRDETLPERKSHQAALHRGYYWGYCGLFGFQAIENYRVIVRFESLTATIPLYFIFSFSIFNDLPRVA